MDHDEWVDQALRDDIARLEREQKEERGLLRAVENRNDALLSIMEEVDYLLQWGRVQEARLLLVETIGNEQEAQSATGQI